MEPEQIRVTFHPGRQSVYVLPGTLLIEAAERAGILIDNPCDGKGTCGKCRLKILEGQTGSIRPASISETDYAAGYRLSCQARVLEELVVEVPAANILESFHQILTSSDTGQISPKTGTAKIYFELDPPSRGA